MMLAALPLAAALLAAGPTAKAAGAPLQVASLAPVQPGLAPSADGSSVDGVDVVEHLGEAVPTNLDFLDVFADRVRLGNQLHPGKPVLLSLVYFDCPMLCSLEVSGLIKSLNQTGLQLGKDYTALTVSFDPKDTPERAAERQHGYLRSLNGVTQASAQDWLFLTGQQPAIQSLASAVGFQYRFDSTTGQYAHPAVTMVLTPDGKISRYLYGVTIPPRDLKLSLVEASGGKIGTSFDRLLLTCFQYDPAGRKYRMVATRTLRYGALATLAGLATLLAFFWRRELQKGGVA